MRSKNAHRIAFMVITRPPEIITCLKVPVEDTDIFVIFDSHPRPLHPKGAGTIMNSSLRATADRLSTIFEVDEELLRQPDLGWQSELIGSFSGHVFVARDMPEGTPSPDRLLMEASVASLMLKRSLAEALQQQYALETERQRMEIRTQEDRSVTEETIANQARQIQDLLEENARLRVDPHSDDMQITVDRLTAEMQQMESDQSEIQQLNLTTIASLEQEILRLQQLEFSHVSGRKRHSGSSSGHRRKHSGN